VRQTLKLETRTKGKKKATNISVDSLYEYGQRDICHTLSRVSREAAKEYSPRRKSWVNVGRCSSSEGAKETPASDYRESPPLPQETQQGWATHRSDSRITRLSRKPPSEQLLTALLPSSPLAFLQASWEPQRPNCRLSVSRNHRP
jgi:hypothetical protein